MDGRSIAEQAKDVRDHYIRLFGRRDPTRTTALSMITMLIAGDQDPEQLKLAAKRYRQEVPRDGIPLGCRRFYAMHWQDFLSPDWEPPPKEDRPVWDDARRRYVPAENG